MMNGGRCALAMSLSIPNHSRQDNALGFKMAGVRKLNLEQKKNPPNDKLGSQTTSEKIIFYSNFPDKAIFGV